MHIRGSEARLCILTLKTRTAENSICSTLTHFVYSAAAQFCAVFLHRKSQAQTCLVPLHVHYMFWLYAQQIYTHAQLFASLNLRAKPAQQNAPSIPASKLAFRQGATVKTYDNSNLYSDRICLMFIFRWLFYDSPNFNADGNAGMEYFYKPTYGCSNFNGISGAVSSAKFVGSPTDYTRDSITFYEFPYFQGVEEYTFTDLANLNLFGRHASLIVTGKTAWTLYDRPNYEGNKVCIFPPPSGDFTPNFVTDTAQLTFPVPHGTVASVRKECYAWFNARKCRKLLYSQFNRYFSWIYIPIPKSF